MCVCVCVCNGIEIIHLFNMYTRYACKRCCTCTCAYLQELPSIVTSHVGLPKHSNFRNVFENHFYVYHGYILVI